MDAPEEVSASHAAAEYKASRRAAAEGRSRVRGRSGALLRTPLVIPSVPEFLLRAAAGEAGGEGAGAGSAASGGEALGGRAGEGEEGVDEDDAAEARRERRKAARRRSARDAAEERESAQGGARVAAAASKRQRGLLPHGSISVAAAAQPLLLAPGMAVHVLEEGQAAAAPSGRGSAQGVATSSAGSAAPAALDPAAAFLLARLGPGSRLKRR